MRKHSNRLIFYIVLCICALKGGSIYGSDKVKQKLYETPQENPANPKATFFITPKAVKHHQNTFQPLDHDIIAFDLLTTGKQRGYYFQTLGNHGTATQPIFYKLPPHIGVQSGLNVYDIYFTEPSQMKYYRSCKSYSYFTFVLLNRGSFMFDALHSRRLKDRLHLNIALENNQAEKEWPIQQDTKIASHGDLHIGIDYASPDNRYQNFTGIFYGKHNTKDFGGVTMLHTNTKQIRSNNRPVKDRLAYPILQMQKRYGLFCYHQYAYHTLHQIYHELTLEKQKHERKRSGTRLQNATYPAPNSHPLFRLNRRTFYNEMGLKGDLTPSFCYAIYYRLQHDYASYGYQPLTHALPNGPGKAEIQPGVKEAYENYLGLHIDLCREKYPCHTYHVDLLYLCSKTHNNLHKLQIGYTNNFCQLTYHSIKHKVPDTVGYIFNALSTCHKPFQCPYTQQIQAKVKYDLKTWLHVEPSITYQRLKHHIFYSPVEGRLPNFMIAPRQSKQIHNLLLYDIQCNLSFSPFHMDHKVTLFQVIDGQNDQVFTHHKPRYIYIGKYYYHYSPAKKHTAFAGGINVYFYPSYWADGYDSTTQQFYRQKSQLVQGRPIVDLFLNWAIGHVKLAWKWSYINFICHPKEPYFVTPFYPGLKEDIDLIINWSFFD